MKTHEIINFNSTIGYLNNVSRKINGKKKKKGEVGNYTLLLFSIFFQEIKIDVQR